MSRAVLTDMPEFGRTTADGRAVIDLTTGSLQRRVLPEGRVHVLIVEMDPRSAGIGASLLRSNGLAVSTTATISGALAVMAREPVHAIVVDADGNRGADICRTLRERCEAPICLVAPSDDELDVVLAFELGADAYLRKPVRPRELVARLLAMVRRSHPLVSSTDQLRAGEVEIDLERHEVRVRGAPVVLTLKEFTLLSILLHHAGRAVRREYLVDRLWGSAEHGSFKTLSSHVHRLREVIEVDPDVPTRLITIRGYGYRYIPVAESGR